MQGGIGVENFGERSRPRLRTWVALFLFAFAVNVGAHLAFFPEFASHPRYFNDNKPLLVTPDGYYFLRQAADWASGTYSLSDPLRPGLRPDSVPPLSLVVAMGHELTGITPDTFAFFLPPILAALLVAVVLAYGSATAFPRAGVVSALFLCTSEAYFSRTALGVYDTDCLIPLLFFGMLYCLYRLDTGKYWWGGAYFALAMMLHFWWPQAGLPMAAVAAGIFAATGLVPGGGKRPLKLCLLVLGVGFLGATWAGMQGHFPDAVARVMTTLNSHLRFLLGEQQQGFAQTGWTIEELMPLPAEKALNLMSGHWVIACLSFVGAAYFTLANPRLSMFSVLPSYAFLGISLLAGNRFIMFTVIAHALGLGWLCAVVIPNLAGARRRLGLASAAAACVAVFGSGMWSIYQGHGLIPVHDASEVALARTVDKAAGKDAAIWNWWGPGYMVQYFGQRETFFDGGLQGPKEAFIAALPLACHSPTLARNWIKFFSVHPDGLDKLAAVLGRDRAIEYLVRVFSNSSQFPVLAQQYSIPEPYDKAHWMFPEREVYLLLLGDMLVRNTWLTIGNWRPGVPERHDTPIFAFKRSTLGFDRDKGVLILPNGNGVEYSKLLFITPDNLSHDNPREIGPIAIAIKGIDVAYVIPEWYFRGIAFQLLYIYPEGIPGFTPVSYNPFVGGVWRVN